MSFRLPQLVSHIAHFLSLIIFMEMEQYANKNGSNIIHELAQTFIGFKWTLVNCAFNSPLASTGVQIYLSVLYCIVGS